MKDIIVIMGPTGVGKTKLSIMLAKKYNAEIINADSMQIYKGLDIATAKITKEEMEDIKHHLLDIKDINENYTVYDYQKDCRNKINEILKRNKKVIIVGGTGLYIKAALFNYEFSENKAPANNYVELTNEQLLSEIKKYNKEIDIHINNRKRLVRYLNKYESNEIITNKKDEILYDATFIALTTIREKLYDRINQRVDEMIDNGLIYEVNKYKDYLKTSKAMQTGIGYKEFLPYYNNEISIEEVIENIKKNSRHYAKRQYTFFKNQFPNINWFYTNFENFQETFQEVCNYLEQN